jgi:hypothetical protein
VFIRVISLDGLNAFIETLGVCWDTSSVSTWNWVALTFYIVIIFMLSETRIFVTVLVEVFILRSACLLNVVSLLLQVTVDVVVRALSDDSLGFWVLSSAELSYCVCGCGLNSGWNELLLGCDNVLGGLSLFSNWLRWYQFAVPLVFEAFTICR